MAQVSQTSSVFLSVARHFVPMCALLAIYAALVPRPESFAVFWLGSVAFMLAASLIVAGLVSLYARTRTIADFATRARNTGWAVVLLLFFSLIGFYTQTPASSSSVASSGAVEKAGAAIAQSTAPHQPSAAASAPQAMYPMNPEGASLMRKVRKDHPELAALPDEEVVRAMHAAFYSDLPLQQVAAQLGVKLEQ